MTDDHASGVRPHPPAPGGRSNRRRAAAVAVVTLLALVAGAAAVIAAHRPTPPGTRSGAAGDGRVTGPTAADARPTTDPRRIRATPEALLELLTRLFHPARIGSPARSADGRLRVQAYLDDGRGPGMIRLGVTAENTPPPCPPGDSPDTICRSLPDGSRASIVTAADNCERRIAVSVHRGGTRVDIDVADCLEFDGTGNPSGRLALTADQTVAVAADGRWGEAMDRDLVAAGAKHFPGLRRTPMPAPVEPVPPPPPIGAPAPAPALALRPVTEGGLQWEDVDGDRAVDYCRRVGPADGGTGRVACTLSAGTGFGRTVTSARLDWGAPVGRDWEDVNGDNRADFCRRVGQNAAGTGRLACTLFTGTAFGATVTSASLAVGQDVGWAWDDANGDNKADYCRRLGRTGTTGRVACTLSTGTGFGSTITSADLDLGRDTGWEWEDVNGDDKADYCRRLGRTGTTGRVACTLSTGTGFGSTITSADLDLGRDTGVAWEDVNRDDKADYCRVLDGGVDRLACTPSTGTGFGVTMESGAVDRGRSTAVRWVDLNADERKDFCRRIGGGRGERLACTLTTGTGFGPTVRSAVLDWGFDD